MRTLFQGESNQLARLIFPISLPLGCWSWNKLLQLSIVCPTTARLHPQIIFTSFSQTADLTLAALVPKGRTSCARCRNYPTLEQVISGTVPAPASSCRRLRIYPVASWRSSFQNSCDGRSDSPVFPFWRPHSWTLIVFQQVLTPSSYISFELLVCTCRLQEPTWQTRSRPRCCYQAVQISGRFHSAKSPHWGWTSNAYGP